MQTVKPNLFFIKPNSQQTEQFPEGVKMKLIHVLILYMHFTKSFASVIVCCRVLHISHATIQQIRQGNKELSGQNFLEEDWQVTA